MNADESRVAALLESKCLRVEGFSKVEKQQSKVPDFRVLHGSNIAFFCEVKTISPDEIEGRLDIQPLTLVGGTQPDPTFNRLTTKIHDAVHQFDAVNPSEKHPNVLAFVNHDQSADLNDLYAVLTGTFRADDGSCDPIYRKFSEGRIRDEKSRIHLYLWIDDTSTDPFYRFNANSAHFATLCRYFGISPNQVRIE